MKKSNITRLLAITVAFCMGAISANALYFGTSVGYLFDDEEFIYSVRVGTEVAGNKSLSHNIEVELGFTEATDSGVRARIVPVMANYRLHMNTSNTIGIFVGGGLGVSNVSVSGFGASDNDTAFTFQLLAGVEYKFTESVSGLVGYRYMWIDEPALFGVGLGNLDDNAIEVGVKFRF